MIVLEELTEMFKWTIKGLGKISNTPMPRARQIQIISFKAFNSADADSNGSLDFVEISTWVELNTEFILFCEKFDP